MLERPSSLKLLQPLRLMCCKSKATTKLNARKTLVAKTCPKFQRSMCCKFGQPQRHVTHDNKHAHTSSMSEGPLSLTCHVNFEGRCAVNSGSPNDTRHTRQQARTHKLNVQRPLVADLPATSKVRCAVNADRLQATKHELNARRPSVADLPRQL
jgi:hypothetical protein